MVFWSSSLSREEGAIGTGKHIQVEWLTKKQLTTRASGTNSVGHRKSVSSAKRRVILQFCSGYKAEEYKAEELRIVKGTAVEPSALRRDRVLGKHSYWRAVVTG